MMDSKANSFPSDDDVTLTIRLIMQAKEVGSIIGKKGEIVNRLRKESGAEINISRGSCPERIVTVTGHPNAILKFFQLFCKSLEDVLQTGGGGPTPLIRLQLSFPSSHCGSLIGTRGSRIKEIREVTGANIMVMSDMLPFSTERAVTISGTSDAITQCIYHICCVMLESPGRETTIPYVPRPPMTGVQDYTIPYMPKPLLPGPLILPVMQVHTTQWNYAVPTRILEEKPKEGGLAGLIGLNTGSTRPDPYALVELAASQLSTKNQENKQQKSSEQSHKMTIPNDLMGDIIGTGGSTITEISRCSATKRCQDPVCHAEWKTTFKTCEEKYFKGQISGAMIDISKERECTDRTITITGNAEAVMLAEYLITVRAELQLRFPISSIE